MAHVIALTHSAFESSWYKRLLTFCGFALVGWVLFRGWQLRDASYLNPEEGAGYWIGILGGSCMLALLLYPVRKHWQVMRNWGPLKHWFRAHMLLGILGPSLILFHSNFGLGSTNSNVALFCMLLVAGSGLVGRYLYTRIHYGLYGQRASVSELASLLSEQQAELAQQVDSQDADNPSALQQQLSDMVRSVLNSNPATPQKITTAPKKIATASAPGWRQWRRCKRLLLDSLQQAAAQQGWSDTRLKQETRDGLRNLKHFFRAANKARTLNRYERLFSLWHVLHLPFFILLVISGVVHVVAVHMY